jgi:hypothetical protein
MTLASHMIITRRGTILPLDRRRRDALSTYAEFAASDAGVPLQKWVRETWGLKDYEAKDLIKGNASETVWERILKQRGPHGGWRVALPILGSVIGEDIAEHFANEKAQVAHERAAQAAEETRLAALEAHARERRSFAGLDGRQAALRDRRTTGERRVDAARMGHRPPD